MRLGDRGWPKNLAASALRLCGLFVGVSRGFSKFHGPNFPHPLGNFDRGSISPSDPGGFGLDVGHVRDLSF